MERVSFTDSELAIAKSVDLTAVASYLGYTVKKVGKYYTLKEMDSIRIYDRKHWFRWSRRYEKGENGGSQIDFLKVFCGMEIREAVFWLLDFAGYERRTVEKPKLKHQVESKPQEKREFVLPEKNSSNDYLYSYLNRDRGISNVVIDFFVSQGLIYESRPYHNIVFKGNDKNGVTRFASMRGVFDKQGKPFKCDVAGNDKRYGFNVVNEKSEKVVVFEAAIDLMSYMDMNCDFQSNMVALGMVSDAPLMTFLEEHPQIHCIGFCLDNDGSGRKATEELMSKYYELGYDVEDVSAPEIYKDYNEWLVQSKITASINAVRNEVTLGKVK